MRYSDIRQKPRASTVVLVLALHILVIYGLVRGFAPDMMERVERSALSAITVTVTPSAKPEAPENKPADEAAPDEGAAGAAGKKAIPKPVIVPKIPLQRDKPSPRASSTGRADNSGAKDQGRGTGGENSGGGPGSGRDGNGQGGNGNGGGTGGGAVTKPSVRSGNLNTARDFPVPEGGRQTRFGKSVTVRFTVTVDGRARDCSVIRSNVDAQTTSMVCGLVISKIRFNPATAADGTAVEAPYGYRVDFKELP